MLAGIPLAGLLVVGLLTIIKGSQVADLISLVAERTIPSMIQGSDLQSAVANSIRGMNAIFLTIHNPAEKKTQIEKVQSYIAEIRKNVEILDKSNMSPRVRSQYVEWKATIDSFMKMTDATLSKTNAAEIHAADIEKWVDEYLHGEPKKIKDEVFQQGEEFKKTVEAVGAERAENSMRDAQLMVQMASMTIGLALLISLVMIVVFTRKIMMSLAKVQ